MGDVLKGDPMSRDFSDISNKQYLSLLEFGWYTQYLDASSKRDVYVPAPFSFG